MPTMAPIAMAISNPASHPHAQYIYMRIVSSKQHAEVNSLSFASPRVAKSSTSFAGIKAGMSPLPDGTVILLLLLLNTPYISDCRQFPNIHISGRVAFVMLWFTTKSVSKNVENWLIFRVGNNTWIPIAVSLHHESKNETLARNINQFSTFLLTDSVVNLQENHNITKTYGIVSVPRHCLKLTP